MHVPKVQFVAADATAVNGQGILGICQQQQHFPPAQFLAREHGGNLINGIDDHPDSPGNSGLHEEFLKSIASHLIIGYGNAIGVDVRNPGLQDLTMNQATVDASKYNTHDNSLMRRRMKAIFSEARSAG
jgi:hypothetical protein